MDSSKNFVTLGPAGTHSHAAALKYMQGEDLDPQDINFALTIYDALSQVKNDQAIQAIVPLENSIQGVVFETLDELYEQGLYVFDEFVAEIDHALCVASSAASLSDIKKVYSHPQALGQCRDFLRTKLPQAELIPTASTALGFEKVLSDEDKNAAAIGSVFAAEQLGLYVLQNRVQDVRDNQTRFAVVQKYPKKNNSKLLFSILALNPEADRPGLLLDILTVFKEENINLTQIESRPARTKFGAYIFFVQLDLQPHDQRIQYIKQALKNIKVKMQELTT